MTTINAQSNLTLVLGGTGKTGRRVVARLQHSGLPVRVGSRNATVPFDWDDRATWNAALRNVHAVYVSFQPDLAVAAAPPAIQAFVDLAKDAGVQRVVLLSGRGEEEAQRCERIVQASGLAWCIVRASWFAQNFSENFLLDDIRAGTVALPVDTVAEPFIDIDDIADVAVAALTDARHDGQLYEVTGPRLLTFAQAVQEIATATQRDIQYMSISTAEFTEGLAAQSVPDDIAALLMYLFTTVLDGRNALLADGVQRALDRAPRDFHDYCVRTAATGVWGE